MMNIRHLDFQLCKYMMVKIYYITKCTTTGYSFPLFSSLLKERGKNKRGID